MSYGYDILDNVFSEVDSELDSFLSHSEFLFQDAETIAILAYFISAALGLDATYGQVLNEMIEGILEEQLQELQTLSETLLEDCVETVYSGFSDGYMDAVLSDGGNQDRYQGQIEECRQELIDMAESYKEEDDGDDEEEEEEEEEEESEYDEFDDDGFGDEMDDMDMEDMGEMVAMMF